MEWFPIGLRRFGRVDKHVATWFVHVGFVPIVPLYSAWDAEPEERQIKLHAGSVVAGYLRGWLPLFVAEMVWGHGDLIVGAALLAIAAITTLRFRRRFSPPQPDLSRTVFGTTCPPILWRTADRARMQSELDARWARFGTTRTPVDVATHGFRHRDEAEVAYGLLALSGAGCTHRHFETCRLAEALSDSYASSPALESSSPYRDPVVVSPPQLRRRPPATSSAATIAAACAAASAQSTSSHDQGLTWIIGCAIVGVIVAIYMWRKKTRKPPPT